jgi:hypothetical protein
MPTITYTDLDGGAPSVEFHGKTFLSTVPVEVDEEQDAELLEAAKENRFFEVSDSGSAPKEESTAQAKGRKAAEDGKPRSVPPAYRGKPEAAAWAYGYDQAVSAGSTTKDPGMTGIPSAEDHAALAEASATTSTRPAGVSSTYASAADTQTTDFGQYPDDAYESK